MCGIMSQEVLNKDVIVESASLLIFILVPQTVTTEVCL
ncbi:MULTISPECIES: DUF2627 domain-containing protein [Candidatus Regiella]|nr:DUF2627 domain-containing protein [Candidatus Regiella insecticola]